MMKLPAFQFYPGDWMKDPNLRRCTHAARGVWVDMLCLMFECDPRGVLVTGGSLWTQEEVALAVGGNADVTRGCISELIAKGVCKVREDGALFSSRMVRDEETRVKTRERVEKYREKHDGNGPGNASVTPKKHPSSSSSSASAVLAPPPERAGRVRDVLFDALAIAEGSDPKQLTAPAAKKIGVALAAIRKVAPDLAPSEIQARARAYRRLYPTAAFTAHALAAHWAKCGGQAERPTLSPLSEPTGWKAFINHEMPDCRYATGSSHAQAHEAHEWSEIDRESQQAIISEMRKKGQL